MKFQMPDNEPFLQDVLEALQDPDSDLATHEECLFVFDEGEYTEFIYQTHVVGLAEDKKIRGTYNGHGKLRWVAEIENGEQVVFGASLPPSRLEDPDPLLSVAIGEPIRISYLRPPQVQEWIEKEGYIEPGESGASKNRGSFYILNDRGVLKFGVQEPGYHELFFEGERVNGRYILEHVPSDRGMIWTLTYTGEASQTDEETQVV